MGLFDVFKKQEPPKPSGPSGGPLPPVAAVGGARAWSAPSGAPGGEQLHHRHPRFVPLRLVHAAAPKIDPKLSGGKVEKRYSYASWTAPSHYNLLTGLLPHTTPPNVYASEYYKEDFYNYNTRLGAKGDIDFGEDGAGPVVAGFLRNTLGYTTRTRACRCPC
jgi:hypothetical protein